jgi:leukotriene-A4 hydrolase
MAARDPNTNSNYAHWRTAHTTANLTIDFASKTLRGSVTLDLVSQTDRASDEIVLDTSHLAISSVRVNGSPASQWSLRPRAEPNGSPLSISVPSADKGATVSVEMDVATTDGCTALQWLTPQQTGNGKAPFMFSQCQAIHARSLFPCQDTPDVKGTVSFRIASPHVVVASGVPVGEAEVGEGGEKVYLFEQKVPIPSYLFALASGDIVTAPIGKRSVVASGPDEIEACKWEFEEDMDRFLDAAESITGVPYKWGEYNVLVVSKYRCCCLIPPDGRLFLSAR